MRYKVRISNFVFGVPKSLFVKHNMQQIAMLGTEHILPNTGCSIDMFTIDGIGCYTRVLVRLK